MPFGNTRRLTSGRWQARYTHRGTTHKAPTTFKTKAHAIAWLVAEQTLIDTATWTPPAKRHAAEEATNLTVNQWLTKWLDTVELRASTRQNYARTITNRIAGTSLADTPLAELERKDVQTWWDTMQATHHTPATNRAAYIRLRSALAAAVDREIIDVNPVVVQAARKRPASAPKDVPATEDLWAIVNATNDRYKLALVLCLFHGMRIGEVLALRRKHLLRLQDKTFVVQIRGNAQRIVVGGHATMVEQPPKTAASRREVPVFAQFTAMTAHHLITYVEPGPEAFLFTTVAGRQLMDTELRKTMGRARVAAGVSAPITPHYGRNWLITHLAEQGATPAEIGTLLGQRDLKTITEVYMKARPDNMARILGRVADQI